MQRGSIIRKADPVLRWKIQAMKIVHYPHPSLRYPAKPLDAIDKQVRLAAGRMLELMYEHQGLGLAAPQVALPFQMIVVNYAGDPEQLDQQGVFLNPVILEKKGTMEGDEGCLSFPGLFQKVRRARTVRVQAYTLEGKLYEATLSDMPSRLWQHEVDHLHAVLFIDKFGPIAELAARGQLRAFEADHRKAQERGELPPDAQLKQALAALERGAPWPVDPPEEGQPAPLL
jgi:peptide deformylase